MSLAQKVLDRSLRGKIDLEIIEELLSMNSMKADFFQKQILLFTRSSQDLMKEFKIAIEDLNESKIKEIAHSLKGSCANFGAVELAEIFDKWEISKLNGTIAELHGSMDEISRKMHEFFAYLHNLQIEVSQNGENP